MIGALDNVNPLKVLGGDVTLMACNFTTDGSGDETLTYDASGKITISRATNVYTLTFPTWATTLAWGISHEQEELLTHNVVITPASGTIAIDFAAANNSNDVSVWLLVTDSVYGN